MSTSTRIRIGTTKTRTGCLTCKQRRIKCDEGKPSCQKCLKSGRACGGYPAIDTVLKIVQYTNAQPFQNRRIQPDGQDATKYSTNHLNVSAYWTAQGISVSGSAFCIPHIGGLRTEPFNALPISSTGDVQEAFDNLHVLQFRHLNEPSWHYYASLLLNDPMFFETMIAFSKLAFKYSHVPQERMTADIRSHIGNVLQQLTPRVPLCQVQSSDAVVLTIYYLLVVCQAAGDFEAFGVHLNGLKRISANRPAADFHCFDGFMSARIQSAELVANFLNDEAGDTLVTIEHPALEYPTPPGSPAPPQLGVPRAFQALAAGGRLSAGGISFLQNVDRYLGRPYKSGTKDRRATLLALRMIESLEATNYPAHALNIERPNNAFPRNSAELCMGYEVEADF